MSQNHERESLRRRLLNQRDNTSEDMLKIAANSIHNRLYTIKSFSAAEKIGMYYSIGSEIPTRDIIQKLSSRGLKVYLPKIISDMIEFREISDFTSLEIGKFGIMEPKEDCPINNNLDIVIVPTVAVSSSDGIRLGYGHGFYDRYLAKFDPESISIVLEKQIIRNIPKTSEDIPVRWIVTEDRTIKVR